MLSNLFKQAQDKSVTGKEQAREAQERSRSPPDSRGDQVSERLPPTLRPSLERGVTTAVSTPHDAVLAELFSHRPGPGANRADAVPEMPENVSRRDDEAETSDRPQSPSRTPLHDPFAGSLVGLTVQDDEDHTQNDRTRFEARKEDLWSHMGNIRDIQTQIANMHVAMENIGLGHQPVQLSVERVHSTAASEGEKWEDAAEGEEDEVKEKDVREREFTKLAEKFHGRKEATENIMTKLDELSRVVTAFHALRTPGVDLNSSRSNSQAKKLLADSQALDSPVIIVPPPREERQQEQQAFVQSPVPIRVGNFGEKGG